MPRGHPRSLFCPLTSYNVVVGFLCWVNKQLVPQVLCPISLLNCSGWWGLWFLGSRVERFLQGKLEQPRDKGLQWGRDFVCVSVCVYLCAHIWVYTCACAWMCVCMIVCTNACMHMCVNMCVCACVGSIRFAISLHSLENHRLDRSGGGTRKTIFSASFI